MIAQQLINGKAVLGYSQDDYQRYIMEDVEKELWIYDPDTDVEIRIPKDFRFFLLRMLVDNIERVK